MRVDIYPANGDGRTFSNTPEHVGIDLEHDAFPGDENREDREIVAAELAHLGRSIFGGGAVPVVLIIPTEGDDPRQGAEQNYPIRDGFAFDGRGGYRRVA